MDRAAWILYLSTLAVVLITPGTSVLLVVSQALHGGWRRALWTIAGDLAANGLQIAIVSVAARAVLEIVSVLAPFLEWGAITFLVVSGLRLVLCGAAGDRLSGSRGTALSTGFVVSISNPAAILFFALLLPMFVHESSPVFPQFAALGAVALSLDGLVLLLYSAASLQAGRYVICGRSGSAAARVAGALRMAGAAVLAVSF